MALIFWDTHLFIYLFEKNPKFGKTVLELYRRMKERGDELLTSTLTVGEVLTKPLAIGDAALVDRYRSLFQSDAIRVVDFDMPTSELYAQIRRDRSIRPSDAIQLACAARFKADLFITNDDRLCRKTIPGITFVSALSTAPL